MATYNPRATQIVLARQCGMPYNGAMSLLAWEGFLPRNSTVMARRRGTASPSVSDAAVTRTKCRLVFVGEGLDEPEARSLLDKMITALGLNPAETTVIGASEAGSFDAEIYVAMGEAATRALSGTGRVRSTLHPAELIRDPALKKKAWADLQAVARELGLAIPGKS